MPTKFYVWIKRSAASALCTPDLGTMGAPIRCLLFAPLPITGGVITVVIITTVTIIITPSGPSFWNPSAL